MKDREYYELISPYEDAMNMLQTRIQVLGHSLYAKKEEQLYHDIQYRIKTKESLEKKLAAKGLEPTVSNAKDCLRDIAGIRIICYFLEDIYTLDYIHYLYKMNRNNLFHPYKQMQHQYK